jgi:hypothetical protein
MKMPDPEKLMNFEQLRKACSDAPRGVPLLVAEAIWRRNLVQKIGHQSYPSWFEAALKRHGAQLHRELYLKEDPSKPPIYMRSPRMIGPDPFSRGPDGSLCMKITYDWMDELLKQQLAMDKAHT